MVDERTLIVPADKVPQVHRALQQSGYVPRWLNLEEQR